MWDLLKYGDEIAVIDDKGVSLSYKGLKREGELLLDAIKEDMGSRNPRGLVFCLCDNVMGSLIGYVSFLNHRIVPAMLSGELDDDLLEKLYVKYKPFYLWCSKEDCRKNICKGLSVSYESFGYVLLKTPYGSDTVIYPDLALLLTTSGSTGNPKFVRQSYRNIRANMDSIVEYLQLSKEEKPVTNLPMNYTYGLSIINTHLDVGATILLTNYTLMQREFWEFVKSEHASSIAGVPYTYEMLHRLRFSRMDLPDLRTMTQAGGKLTPELHREFAEFAERSGKNFVVMYGACEATARMGWLPPKMSVEKQGSMGIAIPGGRFELLDEEGAVIDVPGKPGELVYYGDNVTLGYAENASDLSKRDEWKGRYATGDMAWMDEDGYFYIVGRKKRFLKVFGNRVNLDDCERLLKAKFPDIDLACGGVDDKLYIFSASQSCLQEMKEYLSKKTGLNRATFHVIHLASIPHNESGKTLYKELEKYYV